MELNSLFLKGFIGKIVSMVLSKKLGAESFRLYLNDLSIADSNTSNDESMTVHIDAYVEISKSDLQTIIRKGMK